MLELHAPLVVCLRGTLRNMMADVVNDPASKILDLTLIAAARDLHNGLACSDSVHSEGMSSNHALSSLHLAATHTAGEAVSGSEASDTSFPLGFSIELKLQECIKCGLFVPFDILLISEQGGSVDHYLENLSEALSIDSRMWASAIMSLERWTDAFLIFVAIWISSNPNEVSALLQHSHLIQSMYQNMPGPLWSHHDWEFRFRRQYNHQLLWDALHPQLYCQLFSHCASSIRPNNGYAQKVLHTRDVCFPG